MTSYVPALCLACQRLFFAGGRSSCLAFPDGIPDVILIGGADHRTPIEGDGGITFVQKDSAEAHEAFSDWRQTFLPDNS